MDDGRAGCVAGEAGNIKKVLRWGHRGSVVILDLTKNGGHNQNGYIMLYI
jgi:hypothetical protein